MKKTFAIILLVCAVFVTCLVGCEPQNSGKVDLAIEKANAAAVFTIDVNPGIRVYVREDDTVITVEATNEDGEDVIAELELDGENYETAVEEIVDKMDEAGFLEGDENAVLISVEKKTIEVSEKLHERIEKTFEKHGKKASVIEQELDAIDKEVEKAIGDMAKKYNISEGKAHLIEKIREEFPELPEHELAELKVNDLGLMLEETSDDVKGHFKKVGPPVEKDYIGKEQALAAVFESLEITADDVTMPRIHVTRADGKMVYEVEFVYDGMEYEITVDAATGEILATETEEFEEFDPKEFIDDYCNKNECDMDEIKDQIINEAFGKDEHKDDHEHKPDDDHVDEPKEDSDKNHGEEYKEDTAVEPDEEPEAGVDGETEEKPEQNPEKESEREHHNGECADKPLSRGEILKKVISELEISEEILKKTDAKLYETENGAVYSVMISTDAGDAYKLVVEAYTGAILKVELNGTVLSKGAETAE